MSITDKERINTLNLLFTKGEEESNSMLPFSKENLYYLRPLLLRLNQCIGSGCPENMNRHSLRMLRQMIDELLLEITAQVNWSLGKVKKVYRKKVLNDLGLAHWENRPYSQSLIQSKVA